MNVNNKRYKGLKLTLVSAFTFGSNDYPKNQTLPDGGRQSSNNNSNNNSNNGNKEGAGVAMVQPGGGWANRDISKDNCFICGKKGSSQ